MEPRPAATVILLRDGAAGPEAWLMERSRSVGFMASAWVFPGGRVDAEDAARPGRGGRFDTIPRGHWIAAARELEEEAGVRLGDVDGFDLDRLHPWAHWITPEIEPRRYDTWFFAARCPAGVEPVHDGGEAVNGAWFVPGEAIARLERGELPLAPPTLRTLWELREYPSVDAVMSARRRMPAIMPCFQQDGDTLYVLLPGDPGHPSAESVDPPHRYAFASGRWWSR
jgi:8-oxo-dGTP pyrophosphatase MutT (NUDIX family)